MIFYNNDYDNYINESAGLAVLSIGAFLAYFGMAAAMIKLSTKKHEKAFYISDKEIYKAPQEACKNEKAAALKFCYDNGMKRATDNTLVINKEHKKSLSKTIYLYTISYYKIMKTEKITLEKLLSSNNIKIKYYNEIILQQRKEMFNKFNDLLNKNLQKINKENIYNLLHIDNKAEFLNGIKDNIVFYIEVNDDENGLTDNYINNIKKAINKTKKDCKLQSNFNIDFDSDIDTRIVYVTISDNNKY